MTPRHAPRPRRWLTYPAAARIFRRFAKRPFSRATIYRFLTLHGWSASRLWIRERRGEDGTVSIEQLTSESLIHPRLEDGAASRSNSSLYRRVHAEGWTRGGRIWLPAEGCRLAA